MQGFISNSVWILTLKFPLFPLLNVLFWVSEGESISVKICAHWILWATWKSAWLLLRGKYWVFFRTWHIIDNRENHKKSKIYHRSSQCHFASLFLAILSVSCKDLLLYWTEFEIKIDWKYFFLNLVHIFSNKNNGNFNHFIP